MIILVCLNSYLILGLHMSMSMQASLLMANAGTPIIWAGFLHLSIGNLLLGITEGALIARIFRVPYRSCIILMILANYLSSIGGNIIFHNIEPWLTNSIIKDDPLRNAYSYIWTTIVIALGVTLILETPFVIWILRRKSWIVILSALIISQGLTNGVLFYWYRSASDVSVLTYQITPDLEPPQANLYEMFYLDPTGTPLRMNLDIRSPKTIEGSSKIAIHGNWTMTRLTLNKMNQGMDLILITDKNTIIASNVFRIDAIDTNDDEIFIPSYNARYLHDDGYTIRSDWWNSYYGSRPDGQIIRIGMATPFYRWSSHTSTYLGYGYAVINFDDRLYLVQLEKKLINFIAKGYGATVVKMKFPS